MEADPDRDLLEAMDEIILARWLVQEMSLVDIALEKARSALPGR